jgi:hypothetical protein
MQPPELIVSSELVYLRRRGLRIAKGRAAVVFARPRMIANSQPQLKSGLSAEYSRIMVSLISNQSSRNVINGDDRFAIFHRKFPMSWRGENNDG